ncbi:hypothetical protein HDZ31DRAFT_69793 [Schizophyllum fasciatum]
MGDPSSATISRSDLPSDASSLNLLTKRGGVIAVFKLGNTFKACNGPDPIDLFPTHYITVHQSAIRALSWIRAPTAYASGELKLNDDPTVIASGGYDSVECFMDVREGHGCAMNRTRDVILTMAYAPYGAGAGVMTIDHDDIIKLYSVSPSMLGRGAYYM